MKAIKEKIELSNSFQLDGHTRSRIRNQTQKVETLGKKAHNTTQARIDFGSRLAGNMSDWY